MIIINPNPVIYTCRFRINANLVKKGGLITHKYEIGIEKVKGQPFNRRCRIYSGFHFLLAH